jgi:hypothetical protein
MATKKAGETLLFCQNVSLQEVTQGGNVSRRGAAAATQKGSAVVPAGFSNDGKLFRRHGITGDSILADHRISGIGFVDNEASIRELVELDTGPCGD